ncbi:MAG: hypothetical protein P4M05_27300 [Bradyrhizobium sp.]|nr:hypothetical protein [Bradyrhizobium sp.]
MIEVYPNLFVGSEHDEASVHGQDGWYVIHACKEPYHRRLLGYTEAGAPKNNPEYLIARRPGRLFLNLVDAPNVAYIPSEIIDAALAAIHQNIASSKILVHCNLGQSRSPSIAFLYLVKFSGVFGEQDCEGALRSFQEFYPPFAPARGMADYVRLNWLRYSSNK